MLFDVKFDHLSKFLTTFYKARAKREFKIYKNTLKGFFGNAKKWNLPQKYLTGMRQ